MYFLGKSYEGRQLEFDDEEKMSCILKTLIMGNSWSVDNNEISSWSFCDEEKIWILKIR